MWPSIDNGTLWVLSTIEGGGLNVGDHERVSPEPFPWGLLQTVAEPVARAQMVAHEPYVHIFRS